MRALYKGGTLVLDKITWLDWAYPVQISVCRIWHVIVYNNIDTLNVNSPTNQIRGHKNPFMPLLETLVACQPTTKGMSFSSMEYHDIGENNSAKQQDSCL